MMSITKHGINTARFLIIFCIMCLPPWATFARESISEKPKDGIIRIQGNLESVGKWRFKGNDPETCDRGCVSANAPFPPLKGSVFGSDQANEFWFWADVDEKTGKVLDAQMFGDGDCAGTYQRFSLSDPIQDSYGKITENGFRIFMKGKVHYDANGKVESKESYAVVSSKANLFKTRDGKSIKVDYTRAWTDASEPDRHKKRLNIKNEYLTDQGTGKLIILKPEKKI